MNKEYIVIEESIIVGTDKGVKMIDGNFNSSEYESFLIGENAVEELEKEEERMKNNITNCEQLIKNYKKKSKIAVAIVVFGTLSLYAVAVSPNNTFVLNFKSPFIPSGIFAGISIAAMIPIPFSIRSIKRRIIGIKNDLRMNQILTDKQKQLQKEKNMLLETSDKTIDLTQKTKEYLMKIREEAMKLYNVTNYNDNLDERNTNDKQKKLIN